MRRFLLSVLALLLVLPACRQTYATPTLMPPASAPEPNSTPITSIELHRGVNIGNMLEAPHEGDWGLTVQEEYFDLIKQAGFDFVRLPVKWNGHAETVAPYAIDAAFLTRTDQVIDWALKRNLTIIIDFHN
jgi:endoglucanase